MRLLILLFLVLGFSLVARAGGGDKKAGDELFAGAVPKLQIEIPQEGMAVLRHYHQVWRQERPERIDVHATVRDGQAVYEDVAVHLKGSFTFEPVDAKPSLTLNFDKFVPGRRFHGLSKIHLNNSVQDSSGLCEELARGLFNELGVVTPRATPALVHLNGRDLGICVLLEGANKSFLERNFGATVKGNLYDGGASDGDINKELKVLAGDPKSDRSDLKALVDAAAEKDPAKRLEQMEKVLDVEEFITFAAIEAAVVQWDGYCIGCNNYRVFHDAARDKIVFMPHGLDQLFGTSNSPEMSLTPAFKGLVARALLSIPEAREKYFAKIEEMSKKSLEAKALNARIDRLAERLRGALDQQQRAQLDDAVDSLKERVVQRGASIAKQLANPSKPLKFGEDGIAKVSGWRFKPDQSYFAQGNRVMAGGHELLRLRGSGRNGTGGSWRSAVILDEGHYEFTAEARTRGQVDENLAESGVLLRISGETRTNGIGLSDDWKTFKYEFDVRGMENVELVCEFRGPPGGVAEIDAASMRLTRKGAATASQTKLREPQVEETRQLRR